MERFLTVVWFYQARRCTGQQRMGAHWVVAQCSPSTQMERVLRTSTTLPEAAMKLFRQPDCSYQATFFMGRQREVKTWAAALLATVRYSALKPMAPFSLFSTRSPQRGPTP